MIVREFVLPCRENVLDLREYAEALGVGMVSNSLVAWFRIEIALRPCRRRVLVVENSEEAPDSIGWDYVGTAIKAGFRFECIPCHVFIEKWPV